MKTIFLAIRFLFISFLCCIFAPIAVAQESTKSEPMPTTHTVSYGENIYSIAKKYNLSANDLLHWNKLHKGATLDRGQVILLVSPPTSSMKSTSQSAVFMIPEDKIHTVRYGEYPFLIAKKYNISPNDLLAWNKLDGNARLDYGDKLWLINPEAKISVAEVAEQESKIIPIPENAQHEVKEGDTLYSIAQKYGIAPSDLMKWNQLSVQSVLEIGKKLWLTQR